MTKTPILALAAALVATSLSFTPAAHANGVRLQFGGPLGSFVARPTPGYGGASSAYAKKPNCAPKKAAVQTARHSVGKDEAKTKVARKVERQDSKVSVAKHIDRPAKKQDVQQVASLEKPVESTTPSSIVTTPSASQSLAAASLPVAQTVEAEGTANVETITATTVEDVATAANGEASPAAAPDAGKETVVATTAAAKECKKFIPAVGITVTVGCDK